MPLNIGSIPPLAIPPLSAPDYAQPMLDRDTRELMRLRVFFDGLEIFPGHEIDLGELRYPESEVMLPFLLLNEEEENCNILSFSWDPMKLVMNTDTILGAVIGASGGTRPMVFSTISDIEEGGLLVYETEIRFTYQFETQEYIVRPFNIFVKYEVSRSAPGQKLQRGSRLHPNTYIDRYDSLNSSRDFTDFDKGLPKLGG